MNKKSLIVGHLAPYVLQRNDVCMVAVIRRSPYELESVYKKRCYNFQKITDNLSGEIIGICLYDTIKKFGKNKVAEFDNTAVKSKVTTDKIINYFKGNVKYIVGKIDWLSLISANLIESPFGYLITKPLFDSNAVLNRDFNSSPFFGAAITMLGIDINILISYKP